MQTNQIEAQGAPVTSSGFTTIAAALRDKTSNAAANIYEQIASDDDYQRNQANLRLIQGCVITLSAIATGFVNSLAHQARLGLSLAVILAILIAGFVEKFFFTLRHGLTTTYKAGKQRFYAQLCYRLIIATMVLNVALLCAWIVGFTPPPFLMLWNHWSIAVHFGLALLGVTAVRDADAVIENRMLELKAATARQDIVTIRKAAAVGNVAVLLCAKARGLFDALGLAFALLRNKSEFAQDYLTQIDRVARQQFGHIDGAMREDKRLVSAYRVRDESSENVISYPKA